MYELTMHAAKNKDKLTHKKRYRVENGKVCIEIKIKTANQLFDARDPAPFREKDLDLAAAEYIIESAEEFPPKTPMKIKFYLSEPIPQGMDRNLIREAIHSYFAYEASRRRGKIRHILREGQLFLIMASAILIGCLSLAHAIGKSADTTWEKFIIEGLTISGWVAMWKPMDLLLYQWIPVRRQSHIFDKLATIEVDFE